MCAPVNHWGSMRHSMAEEPQPQFFFKKCIISIDVSVSILTALSGVLLLQLSSPLAFVELQDICSSARLGLPNAPALAE
jgi:hypothetical protein